MLVLTGPDVRSALPLDTLRTALAAGYTALTDGGTDVPVRTMTRTPTGMLGTMPGYVDGFGLAAKLVSIFPENEAHRLPTHLAMITLFDELTGVPLALIDGEAITELRTAASSALACDLLAPADASVLTVVGAGVQGASHVAALRSLRAWSEIRITNRTPGRAAELASRWPDVTFVESIADALDGADVVACTTNADRPLFAASQFHGRHLSSVGIHLEIPPEVLTEATIVVQTRAAVTIPPPNGPPAVHGLDPADVIELGELVTGTRTVPLAGGGRTVWLSVGHAMEDVVAARLAYDWAVTEGVGREVDM